ncbi:MAG: NADH-quinone oxidoreductase subunit NuoH [Dehalococcoidia bacterium]|nr:NADH-quinone oxidoreductase subunit NuoH [Dehalococcoidia bacterium]
MTGVTGAVGVLLFALSCALAAIWIERKLIGRMQIRYGPNRVGPKGLLQPIADAIKVIGKEAITPFGVDKVVYAAAPLVIFIPALLTFAVVPFAPGAALLNVDIGVLFVVAVGALGVMPIFMAGWASNNKYSLMGAMRAIAQTVSYEIPLVLSLVGLVLMAGSFKMEDLVLYQIENGWFLLLQPLAALIFFIAASAELNRTPTDIMEGESELAAGYHTEYSGFKFSLFYATEYTHVFAVSALISTLFLGGWGTGPVLDQVPAIIWFIAKTYLLFCVFVWTRATLPRLRIDQLMAFAWKFLLPLSLVNIMLVAVLVELNLPGIVVFAVNAVLAVVLIKGWAGLLSARGATVEQRVYIRPAAAQ